MTGIARKLKHSTARMEHLGLKVIRLRHDALNSLQWTQKESQ